MAQILLDAGVPPNVRDMHNLTPLMTAARNSEADMHVSAVRVLLQGGANPHVKEGVSHGFTAYDSAKYYKHYKLCSVLQEWMEK